MNNQRFPRQSKWSPGLNAKAHSHRSQHLSQLQRFAEAIANLETALNNALPPLMKNLFVLNTLKQGTLTVTCAKATHKALFMANEVEIVKNLNQTLAPKNQVLKVKVKVKPKITERSEPPRHQTLSDENSDILATEAMNTKDEGLKEVLLRLAKR